MFDMKNKKYKILEIDENASENEIKIAYKQLAKKYHPDYNQNLDANEKFIEIHEAYKELLNPKVEKSFFSIFGFESWERMISKDDFDIPPVDIIALKKAERKRDRLYKIHEKEGKPLEKKIKERFDKEVEKGLRNKYYNFEFIQEIAKLETWVNYCNASQKCKEIKYGRFKEYNWAKNKVKLLCKLHMKLQSEYNKEKMNMQKITNHLERVLNNDINIKERIQKPTILNEPSKLDYDHIERKQISKLEYDIQNQFHPKFLNKLPMRIQIFIRNKIKNLINK